MDTGGILGAEHKAVQAKRGAQHVRAACVPGGCGDQLQIIGAEHRQVVHGAKRVVAARRQGKAQAAVGLRARVDLVADINHHMV